MKKSVVIVTLCFLAGFASFIAGWLFKSYSPIFFKVKVPEVKFAAKPKPLERYAIENLARQELRDGVIKIERLLAEEKIYSSYLFSFNFNPNLDGKTFKKTTGVLNLPVLKEEKYPVVLLLRGYVDQKIYTSGMGTKRAGEYFAKNGFITIAPDFLGYGGSDREAENIFESRFQTYVTILSLLASLQNNQVTNLPINKDEIFIWSHSNGGQIALTILEITGKSYPTVLWAPVSKPFPYSVLYYTDESDDGGKLIRKELAKFEDQYDTDLYSISKYFDRIKAPIQLHQGTADDAVPKDWSDNLNKILKSQDLEVKYYIYPGADHNLQPSWNNVVEKDLNFFNKHLTPED